jgi:LEA14-like dessication related protein
MFIEKPDIAVKEVSLVGIDRDGVEMDVELGVTNHNSSSITLTGYRYQLLVSELPMSRGERREPYEFQGGTTTDIRLPLRITYRDLLEILKRLPDPDHIPYQLTADIDLDSRFGSFTVPVAKRGHLGVPQRYRLDNILKQLDDFLKKETR